MDNVDKIRQLIPLWYAQKAWAEELLIKVFKLECSQDILKQENRGNKPIPGTNWRYRTHGVGVDVYRTEAVGGIDFDFDKPVPDEWRLRVFFEKQYNECSLLLAEYRELYEDEELWNSIVARALAQPLIKPS